MSVARRLGAFLDEHKVSYYLFQHQERYTSTEIAEALHVPGRQLAKVVMVKLDGRLAMAVVPGDLRVDLEALARAAGASRTELATEQEFEAVFPDCEVGAMPPFGNLYDVPVYVDRTLAQGSQIVFEAGNHHEALKISYSDFDQLVRPTVTSIAGR